MAKRKIEYATGKMQPDAEAVKAEDPSPEEKSAGESEAQKAEEHPLEEELAGESEAEKAEEHPPEEEPAGESGSEKTEEHPPEEEPAGESGSEKAEEHPPEEKLSMESEAGLPTIYKIVCRNKITKRIGGVDFMDGEGFTLDGYAASWFAAKDGYTVESAEMGQLW